MSEHTKGEWEVGTYRYGEIWVGANFHIATCHRGSVSEEKCQANARLIAAAPDLLGACKAVRIELKLLRGLAEFEADICIATVQERINQINFAIAKAEKS